MKYIVEYSGYVEVDATSEEEAIEVANEDLYDLDMVAYTRKEWKEHLKNRSRKWSKLNLRI